MSEEYLSVDQAERKIFSSSFDDGLVDIFISTVVMMFAIAPFLSPYLGDFWSSAIFLPLWGLTFLVLYWIRKNFIRPRSGSVKFGPSRKKKLSTFSWIMLGLNAVFLLFGLVIGFVLPSEPGLATLLPFSMMVLVLFSLAAYFLSVNRFYVYGLMLAVGPFVGEWLFQNFSVPNHGYPLIFGIYAAVIFVTGLFKLYSFLQDNPLPGDEQLKWEGNNG